MNIYKCVIAYALICLALGLCVMFVAWLFNDDEKRK